MKLFNKFRRKTSSADASAAVPATEKMNETEIKLVNSLSEKPSEWRITPKPAEEGTDREWYITHTRSGIRILMPESVAKAAYESKPVNGTATYGGYHFQSEFIRHFGSLAYARYKIQDAEDTKRETARSLAELTTRVSQWK